MIGKSGGEEKEGEKVGNALYGTKQEQEDITVRAIIILKEESEQTGQARSMKQREISKYMYTCCIHSSKLPKQLIVHLVFDPSRMHGNNSYDIRL